MAKDGKEEEKRGYQRPKRDDAEEKKVPLYMLFSFADGLDVVLMALGTVAAVANGLSMPLMTFIFGELVNAFGLADTGEVVHRVSKVRLLRP